MGLNGFFLKTGLRLGALVIIKKEVSVILMVLKMGLYVIFTLPQRSQRFTEGNWVRLGLFFGQLSVIG